ncbi:MAG: GNAT family N-acetyltransferase [Planctomycetes bacterium]|nr:GNAT family N-acetyltransferase [Planctomycetota bacterium]
MSDVSQSMSSGKLKRFDPLYAPVVASWVQTREQLRWLAPRTSFPLTAAKVGQWTRQSGEAFLFFAGGESMPCGYGELNPMKGEPTHQWLGHLIVDIARRRMGLGRQLTNHLSRVAIRELGAQRLSLVVFPDNKAALHCYLQCGFSVTAEEYQKFDSRSIPQRMIRLGRIAGAASARPSADPAG